MTTSGSSGYPLSSAQPLNPGSEPLAAAIGYQSWGWPVRLYRDQVHLDLETGQAVALVVPPCLATVVATTLTTRCCPVPVLACPGASQYRVLLAGECSGVRLPWPPEVRRLAGTVLLPPTPTRHGAFRWHHSPRPDSLRLCREVDILVAIRDTRRPPAQPGSRSRINPSCGGTETVHTTWPLFVTGSCPPRSLRYG
jgi:hypothetical protein